MNSKAVIPGYTIQSIDKAGAQQKLSLKKYVFNKKKYYNIRL